MASRAAARLLGGLLALAGCRSSGPGGAPEASAPAERAAELFFSTGLVGYVEPCGCTSKPLGGLPRLATVIGQSTLPHGLVDAGRLLFPETIDRVARDQHVLKARVLARMFRRLGVLAINLSATDLAEGAAFLKELQAEGSVPFVSTNVRPTGDGGPSVAVSFLRELGGIKIGIAGVAPPERFSSGATEVAAVEYVPALKAELESLRRRGAEVVVVLAELGEAEAIELAALVPGIDVIVRSPGAPITESPIPPKVASGVVILEAGSQGQHVGRLTIRLPERVARPLAFDDGGAKKRAQDELTTRKIAALERQSAALGEGPEAEAGRAARAAQIERLRASLAPAAATTSAAPLRFELIPLSVDVPEADEAKQVLAAYYTRLKELNLDKGDPAPCAAAPGRPTYVGTEACKECHEEAYEFWKKTKHAEAWATLERDDKHFDLTCVGCHTVGYQLPGGFCRLKDVGVLKDVGCEMCHGPGSQHVADEDIDAITLEVTEDTCKRSCHVPEHSDTFDFEPYVAKITGEGHERAR